MQARHHLWQTLRCLELAKKTSNHGGLPWQKESQGASQVGAVRDRPIAAQFEIYIHYVLVTLNIIREGALVGGGLDVYGLGAGTQDVHGTIRVHVYIDRDSEADEDDVTV